MVPLWKVYSDSVVGVYSDSGAQSLTEYWNLHNGGSAGSESVLQTIVLLVYRFYNT